jgi:multidrug efflux pump subunit AcrB
VIVVWLRRYAAVVWIGAIALAITGAASIFRLPSSIYPEMKFPRVVVVAHLGQLAPELVEAQVTRPLEQELATVPGVRYVRARTIRGAVELSLLLTDDSDPLQAANACRAAIDRVDLPKGATTAVQRVLPTSVPVITFNLGAARGATADPRHLREVGELIVRPAFARVPGVGGVELQGGRVRAAIIQIHPAELAALKITPAQLAAKLEASDVLAPVGRVFDEHQTLSVVLDAQAPDLARLRQIPIAHAGAAPITLSAVADVVEGALDPDVAVRGPSGEVVAVSVARMPGASTVEVVHGVLAAASALRTALPANIELTAVYDQAELVDESMASVRDAILIGVALSLLVIALSLRDWRAGLIAALPIPVTLLGTFAIMSWAGVTLNLMSLGGLAVSIGLVVDDAIVVAEGIVARIEEDLPVPLAVERGVGDMFAAVIGTTFTTVVVFAPLGMLSGVTGSFLGAFAITLAIAVLLSMLTSLTLIPLLANRLRRRTRKHVATPADRLGRAIRWLVHRRVISVVVIVVLLGAGYLAQRGLATGFLPAMDEGAFVVDFTLPAGTSLEETDRISLAVDDVLRNTPGIRAFTRRTGAELGPATATVQNEGDVMVRLAPRASRDDIEHIIDHVRGALEHAVPEARFEYVQLLQDVLADLAGTAEPIEVRVLGEDRSALQAWAEEAGEALEKRAELVDVFDGREGMIPMLRSRIDTLQLAGLDLDAATVSADLEVAITGRAVAQILRPERAIDVQLRYPDAIRFSAPALAKTPIAYGPGLLLGDVVAFDRPLSPAVLRREGLRSALVMTAATRHGDLGAAESAVREVIRQLPPPRGTQIEIGGQAASGAQSRREMLRVAGIAIVLVLLVLLLQLRSLRVALVILVGAPLSTVGGLIILALTGTPLNVSSLTGLILLVGLVVKNGILLLEYAHRLIDRGETVEDALVAAARRRLRPIVMTTVATLAGLAPLAYGIGAGSELQRPLAIAVIGGLVFATVVTLVVTPGLAALVGIHAEVASSEAR